MLRIEIFRRAKKFMSQFEQLPSLNKLEKAIEQSGWTIIYYDDHGHDPEGILEKFKCREAALRTDAFVYQNGPVKFIALYDDFSKKSKKRRLYHECGHIFLKHEFSRLSEQQEQDAERFADCCMRWKRPGRSALPYCVTLLALAMLVLIARPFPGQETTIQVVLSPVPPASYMSSVPDSSPLPALSDTVYFTPAGQKYHRYLCPYLAGKYDLIQLPLYDALQAGKTPCQYCYSH